jgi:hypothetical protein
MLQIPLIDAANFRLRAYRRHARQLGGTLQPWPPHHVAPAPSRVLTELAARRTTSMKRLHYAGKKPEPRILGKEGTGCGTR